ncbi:MAG: endonuclease/exonuclease/phosphatase family protein [Pricia sp.]
MKGLSTFNKIVYALNLVFVFLLLLACAVPYLTVDFLPFLSFLSLAVPVLVAINFLFFLCWAIQGKRQMLPSFFVLLFGYFVLGTFLKLGSADEPFLDEDIKVMSYNVRSFTEFGWAERGTVFQDIRALILQERPDIVCIQEISIKTQGDFLDYPYHYLKKISTGDKVHLGIFSKYPIINAETIHFPNSINNGSYADIAYKGDTLRLYNLHMQSLGITPGTGVLRSQSSERLYKKVVERFKKQEEQAEMIREHIAGNPYPTLLCGDFNNTQFSKEYHLIKGNMQDSFIEAGSGLGRTFNYLHIPLRIDFIMADDNFEIQGHKNYDLKYSDHYPVMASFRMKD